MSDLSDDAIWLIRECLRDGLGFNCTWVDDNVRLAVILAQRAVLAGLASDMAADAQRRMTDAAEPHRATHEAAIGRVIGKL